MSSYELVNKFRYGLIGCGRIAPNHLAAALANQENLEIVALCDIIPSQMDSLLETVPDIGRTNISKFVDYREMLVEANLDLVAIATESGKHAAIAIDCINAGCHVIIEKPIALSISDADNIILAAKSHGVVVSACHQNRFNKSIQKIREAHDAGQFGKLLHGTAHIRWNRGESYYRQAPWRGTWEEDGGALMNQCIHNIDLLRWMMGDDIVEVFAYTDNLMHPYIEAEDFGVCLIKFKNGAYGLIEGTTNIYPRNLEETLYLFGEKGTVKAGGKSVNIIEEWMFADESEDPQLVKAKYQETPPNVYGFGHTPLYRDVMGAIREGRKPYVSAEDGKRAVELVLAIYESARKGVPIQFPLVKGDSMDNVGRFFDE